VDVFESRFSVFSFAGVALKFDYLVDELYRIEALRFLGFATRCKFLSKFEAFGISCHVSRLRSQIGWDSGV
jgi:hypothetical protein